jgi:cytochrome P450
LVGVLPSVLARKAIAGRSKVVKAFEDYFNNGGHENASILMRNRYETSSRNGISNKDIARYEVGGSLAVLVNTAPAAFWMLLYVFSYPDVLEDIRREIGSILTTTTDEKAVKVYSLDITSVKTSCPLLTSTFQEVLRHRSMGTSIRQVMQDTVLDGQWLLKKDAMIQMPSRVIHKDASMWGSDVDEFNARRFMKDQKHKTEHGKRPNAAAFRAFGGGTTLCPGRHFATNEILALVSMFVMRFDMVPTAGTWSMPDTNNTNVAAVVMEPDTDVEVEISQRKGLNGRWAFSLKDSDTFFTIVAEDQTAE